MIMCTSADCYYKNSCYRANNALNKDCECVNFEYTCNENNGFQYYILYKENQQIKHSIVWEVR